MAFAYFQVSGRSITALAVGHPHSSRYPGVRDDGNYLSGAGDGADILDLSDVAAGLFVLSEHTLLLSW
jgi:hypothetical protein